MEKMYSHILGTPVYEDDALRPVTSVKDVVMDPENGKMAALVVNINRALIITPIDIYSWGDTIKINNRENIISAKEVMRVEELLKRNVRIFGNKVYNKEGDYLGKVYDFTLDSSNFNLNKIYVSKTFFGLLKLSSRIIAAKNIIEILPEKIVVNDLSTVKEESKVKAGEMAMG